MDLATVYSRAQLGITAPSVSVEVHITGGLPRVTLVGLPETAVRESRERVRSAILNSSFEFPDGRITINLAPAELPKAGGRYDLAIAVGILAASRQLSTPECLQRREFLAELALDGSLRDVSGTLPAALEASAGGRELITTARGAGEAALASPGCSRAASTLRQVVAHLEGQEALAPGQVPVQARIDPAHEDLADVRGQLRARRALEIAAAGGHNLLLVGPPGTGKTMLARRIGSLLPRLDTQQALESAAVASVSSAGFDIGDFGRTPFRAPHHSASAVALVGGGNPPRPGEVSLAHNGVLFLDELAEFPRHVLDVLREPLESHRILISRAARQAEFPARVQLVAAMNPCPCGMCGDPRARCRCSAADTARHRGRISGPMRDRFDLMVDVPRLREEERSTRGESSASVRRRVAEARRLARARQGCINAHLHPVQLARHTALDEPARALIEDACERLRLSERARQRAQRVARTIADLDASDRVDSSHLAEALSLRASVDLGGD